jgi:dipeptidyl aminopeptidase/acylaminoacyl peptidase
MSRLFCGVLAIMLIGANLVEAKRPLALEDMFSFKRVGEVRVSPDGKWVAYQQTSVSLTENKSTTNIWIDRIDDANPPRQLTSSNNDRRPRWSPDGTKILFESTRSGDSQLWVIDLKLGGEATRLTSISTGAATGIWSPDGKTIAFVSAVYPEYSNETFAKSDELNKKKIEAVSKSPVKAKIFTRLFFRHWNEYIEDKRQHLFVIPANGGEPKDVTPGYRDAYPTSMTFSVGDDFTFSPDSSHLIFTAVPDRDEAWSTNYELCRVSVAGGEVETLTKGNEAADSFPVFSPDGKRLAYRAQKRPGYEADKWDIMVAESNASGAFTSKPVNVTASKDVSANEIIWSSNDAIAFTADINGAQRYFTASLEGKIQDGLLVKGGAAINTPGTALSSLTTDNDRQTWAVAVAQMRHPAQIEVYTAKGNELVALTINPNETLLGELDLPKPESVSVPVEGGKMQMWILKPPGFDPAKKWPVAYLVHGGPQSAWEDAWSFRWNPELWAAQGYVVALPNPRGSTGFGQKYVDEISGDWGGKCYDDLLKGVDYVESLPFVDKNRIASAGGSFGGYMMNWFAVNTNRFKTLITHCSVWNFDSMWGTTDELWFDEYEHGGLPWEKPESYAKFSPHRKAGNLSKYKTPMLIIHNDLDFRCPIGQGHELFTSLQRQKVPSRFVNFPDEGHWVLKPKNSEYWHQEVFGWLKKYCEPGGK